MGLKNIYGTYIRKQKLQKILHQKYLSIVNQQK